MTRGFKTTPCSMDAERFRPTVASNRAGTLMPERRWWAWALMGLAGPALGLLFPHWVVPFIILRPGGAGPFRFICLVAGTAASLWAVGVAWLTIHQVNRALNDLAWKDSLTGLANPRAFHRLLQQCLDEAREGHRPFCLLVADLDHFKHINDTYGHVAGDEVLVAVSQALLQAMRSAAWAVKSLPCCCPTRTWNRPSLLLKEFGSRYPRRIWTEADSICKDTERPYGRPAIRYVMGPV